MPRAAIRSQLLIPSMIALLVVLATGTALLMPGDGSQVRFVTAQGEETLLQATGLYHDLPVSVAREGIVWDVINLFIAVPAFILALWFARRGSLRGRLAVAGLSLYFAYAYLMWATLVFNALFLVYVGIFGLGLVNLFLYLAQIDPVEVREHMSPRFPRRFFAGFAFASGGIITVLWTLRIVEIMRSGHFPPELIGLTALETQALDLGLIVPLSIASGWLLLKDHPWGYVLTALQLTFGFIMFLTIPAWIVVPLVQDGKLNLVEAAPFLALCAVGFVLVGLFLRNLREGPRAAAT